MDLITLPNGARLLLNPVPDTRIASLGFFWGAGSRHEKAAEAGASSTPTPVRITPAIISAAWTSTWAGPPICCVT